MTLSGIPTRPVSGSHPAHSESTRDEEQDATRTAHPPTPRFRLASKDRTQVSDASIPFGAMEPPKEGKSTRGRTATKKKKSTKASASEETKDDAKKSKAKKPKSEAPAEKSAPESAESSGDGTKKRKKRSAKGKIDWRKTNKRRGRGKRPHGEDDEPRTEQTEGGEAAQDQTGEKGGKGGDKKSPKKKQKQKQPKQEAKSGSGMLLSLHGGFGVLTSEANGYIASKKDIFVPQRLMQKYKLREGSIVSGRISKGQKHKFQLLDVEEIDGKPPKHWANVQSFKNLVTVDPDFHYAVGETTGDLSMRILDIICPVGRGQRGLIVAPPRAGKTTIMREFAKGIEQGYPEVHLMVLLVDERPEEATEWKRSTKGQVFVSTSDEMAKKHVALAEAVWKRCTRLVEMGEDVVLLLDSITRLARAYNNLAGGSGRTMSGGLDSRAMERPRQIFGSARNTESQGSLTILGTTLVETGSRMDTLIFEEFKGTGNMELVLSRKLADRRIFPAIDIERSGTRKEEKLVGKRRLKWIHTLRRVLARMSFIEAMELLQTKLIDVEHNDDFLKRFEVDPDA